MIEKHPYFRETGKRMIVEWSAGKVDITEGAKRRRTDKALLDEMTLSNIRPKTRRK